MTVNPSPLRTRVTRPLTTLVASAKRITEQKLTGSHAGKPTATTWQAEAWDMYDLVGELRFLSQTLAGRMAQARFYVGELADDPSEDPEPVTDPNVIGVLDALGGSAAARAQLVHRLGVNLFVAGDGWVVGVPKRLLPESATSLVAPYPQDEARWAPTRTTARTPVDTAEPNPFDVDGDPDELLRIEDLEWRALSVTEVSATTGGDLTLHWDEDVKITTTPDQVVLIRVWRPHPRRWWEADSPTRSELPVLKQIIGLTMQTSAGVDSRLAGAGVLVVPTSAQRALAASAGVTETDVQDWFTESLMEAMLTPIGDRGTASAVVPLVVTVPDEATGLFQHLKFDQDPDGTTEGKLDQAIRRLALGLDAPPELLLGTSGMNHWGAFLVKEDVVSTHLEPPLALICDALTTQYLWPVLADQGMPEERYRQFVIWYDVSDLVTRPNRSQDAFTLHERGVIDDEALRGATGFDDSQAPEDRDLPLEVTLALKMAEAAPSLAQEPGLPALAGQITRLLAGDFDEQEPTIAPMNPAPGPVPPGGPPPPPPDGVPQTDGNPPQVPAQGTPPGGNDVP